MTSVMTSNDSTAHSVSNQPPLVQPSDGESRCRFTKAVTVALGVVTLPYVWILWISGRGTPISSA
jgi:hypothetical protein